MWTCIIVTTVAGMSESVTLTYPFTVKAGIGRFATFAYPAAVVNDNSGGIYVADDTDFRIRYIDTNGKLSRNIAEQTFSDYIWLCRLCLELLWPCKSNGGWSGLLGWNLPVIRQPVRARVREEYPLRFRQWKLCDTRNKCYQWMHSRY